MSEQLRGSENGFESHSLRQNPVDSLVVAPANGETPAKTGQFLYPKFTQLKRTPLKRTGFKRKPKRGRPRRAIDYSKLTLPKPVREVAGVKEYPAGRIVFNRRHVSGAHAYQCAVILMADRQGWLCSICGKAMLYEELSFEHGNLRGGGKRNDDPLALDPEGYFWNSAAHCRCNVLKGSRRDYPMALRLKPESSTEPLGKQGAR